MACAHGDLKAVKHIVENWGVNVEASAVYWREPQWVLVNDKIERASPLFVAARCGHLDIARYLVEKGADITATTISNEFPRYHGLTPLHGAFFAHFRSESYRSDMVMFLLEAGADPSALPFDGTPIWEKYSCSLGVIKALVNHGMDLNQRFTSPIMGTYYARNITILHFFAGHSSSYYHEDVSFAIVKLLVEKGADLLLKDDEGFSPLLRAAYGEQGYDPQLKVLDFLLENDSFSRMEKIEAMELAGAVILGNSRTAKFPIAHKYLRRALQLRQMEKDSKIPLQRGSGETIEWVNSEELERGIQNPSEYKMQSLLVRLRILSKSPGALASLLHRGKRIHIIGDYVKHLHLSWVTLDTIGRSDNDKLDYAECVTEVTSNLVTTLTNLGKYSLNLLTDNIIETSLEFISKTDHLLFKDNGQVHKTGSNLPRNHLKTLLELVTFLATLPRVNNQTAIREKLETFVQRARCDTMGQTLLHHTCNDLQYLSLPTIRFLIDSGALPTTADINGDAPLHFLARLNNDDGELVASAGHLLLEKGAHLDQRNNSRRTAAEVWMEKYKAENRYLKRTRNEAVEDAGWRDRLPTWLRDDSVPQLQCLTARAIRTNNVPFSKLPPSLKRFVKLH